MMSTHHPNEQSEGGEAGCTLLVALDLAIIHEFLKSGNSWNWKHSVFRFVRWWSARLNCFLHNQHELWLVVVECCPNTGTLMRKNEASPIEQTADVKERCCKKPMGQTLRRLNRTRSLDSFSTNAT